MMGLAWDEGMKAAIRRWEKRQHDVLHIALEELLKR